MLSQRTPTSVHQKLSCGSQNYPSTRSPWHSSPSTTSQRSLNGFRRVCSDGNLEELSNVSYNADEFGFSNGYKKFKRKSICLEPIPSFSSYSLGTCQEDEDSDEEGDDFGSVKEKNEFSIGNQFDVNNMFMKEEMSSGKFEGERKMYLATGLGAADISCFDDNGSVGGGNGGDGGGKCRPVAFDRDGGDSRGGVGMEEHYKKLLEESPGNPLVLRNYAQFLYQRKRDLRGAEEYYSRAILADPGDGEILSQYAKLVWELHRDEDRATNYFKRAVQASSQDSHVQASYASFLWEIEDEDEDEESQDAHVEPRTYNSRVVASATA